MVAFSGVKKSTSSDPDSFLNGRLISDETEKRAVLASGAQLLAGTAWLFSEPDLDQALDYLFVDEAGQVALTNLVAMGMSARNLIMLGDQMQLQQPIQGVHPGHSGESVLDYLLQGEATIADDRGVFLPNTWRMHEDVCRFISEAVYDGRLNPAPGNEHQRLVLGPEAHPALRPTGIRFIPIEHQGCSQRSEEEAEMVREIYLSLLEQSCVDREGEQRPMGPEDILVVSPYNMQINLLKQRLPQGARVGTVDKFQGQEAQVVIVSMATSSGEDLPVTWSSSIARTGSTSPFRAPGAWQYCWRTQSCSPSSAPRWTRWLWSTRFAGWRNTPVDKPEICKERRAPRQAEASYRSDQGELWKQIDALQIRAKVASPTRAMRDLYTAKAHDFEACLGALGNQGRWSPIILLGVISVGEAKQQIRLLYLSLSPAPKSEQILGRSRKI